MTTSLPWWAALPSILDLFDRAFSVNEGKKHG